jgi:hypothetical protein
MKTIQPISIWVNGAIDTATVFNLTCINDNLFDSAIFYYELKDNTFITIADGNLTMVEPDYTADWTTNNAAYLWAATKLNLDITGDYVAPPIQID